MIDWLYSVLSRTGNISVIYNDGPCVGKLISSLQHRLKQFYNVKFKTEKAKRKKKNPKINKKEEKNYDRNIYTCVHAKRRNIDWTL